MKRIARLFVALCCLALTSGCGDGTPAPPAKAQVSGTVTLDGKPMEGGEVRFNAAGQPATIIKVKDGAFAGEAFVGENRIDVLWEKEGAPHPMDPTQRLMQNVVAAKYSGPASPFKEQIAAEGASNLTFAVTSGR